jgi:hypothetical protein
MDKIWPQYLLKEIKSTIQPSKFSVAIVRCQDHINLQQSEKINLTYCIYIQLPSALERSYSQL